MTPTLPVVRAAQARVTETPNAVMTTLASPTLGPSSELSMWRVEMSAGQQGPVHSFDVDQVWTVVAGHPTIEIGEEQVRLGPNDTIALPAHAVRRVIAGDDTEFLVCGSGSGRATPVSDGVPGEPVLPPWVA